jgi:hypothetical protein
MEAFLFIAAVKAILPYRLSQQVIWSRFVNLSGGSDSNLDGDYVLELFNKVAKARIGRLGPNHSAEMVDRIGKTAMLLADIERTMCVQLRAPLTSGSHTKGSDEKDFLIIVEQLVSGRVLTVEAGRCGFLGIRGGDVFVSFNKQSFIQFFSENKVKYASGKWMF